LGVLRASTFALSFWIESMPSSVLKKAESVFFCSAAVLMGYAFCRASRSFLVVVASGGVVRRASHVSHEKRSLKTLVSFLFSSCMRKAKGK